MLVKRVIVETFDEAGKVNREITEEYSEGVTLTHKETNIIKNKFMLIRDLVKRKYGEDLICEVESQRCFNALDLTQWYTFNSQGTMMMTLHMTDINVET